MLFRSDAELSSAIAAITIGNATQTITAGSYLTGGGSFTANQTTNGSVTLAVDATSANTASKVVARDSGGNFSAGTITAALTGNASTATTLQTPRTINGVSFNGSANISFGTDAVSEGSTNLYYTDARARSAISVSGSLSYNSSTGVISYTTPSTSSITEGTNLYYTDTRARAAVSAGTGISYSSSTGVISADTTVVATKAYVDAQILTKDNSDEITEGSSNLYFTNARARSAISVSGSLSYNSSTGVISYTTPSTSSITEGTNLYYTDARSRAAHSFSAGSGAYNSTTGVITIPTNTNQLTNGAGFYKSGDNVSFGTVSSGALTVTGDITATGEITAYFSDINLKKDITAIQNPIAKVKSIRGVTFSPNEVAVNLGVIDQPSVGVIAQEVELVMPELVTDSAYKGYKTVKYDKLTALLIEAVKEQQEQIDALRAEIASLKDNNRS